MKSGPVVPGKLLMLPFPRYTDAPSITGPSYEKALDRVLKASVNVLLLQTVAVMACAPCTPLGTPPMVLVSDVHRV